MLEEHGLTAANLLHVYTYGRTYVRNCPLLYPPASLTGGGGIYKIYRIKEQLNSVKL